MNLKEARKLFLNPDSKPVKSENEWIRKGKKYEIILSNERLTDALLLFGRHKGKKVSQLVSTYEGYNYLRWILDEDFPEELKQVVKQYV